ncbi:MULTISPECIES: carboxymuconolactone decarboxylase family protein [Streptomyces]|jgi:alkylhydroperoxidase family enzyme|uniref:carboxymuconolactone decarboxylase family protein n=1 Tax=Streptomyces TaxID=1883 RepID=UPI001905A059|nr:MULTISPECIES: carboxymuconolactone decarboxylase family protein [unclassified Streptomyces]MCU4747024.1 carboxymuconolactone decarboxylase family protein [Streptomyces sp. G-5]QQN77702.1 carboxymuconolactone decarboxylase family protein [Streptomyces sp. XC 2026]
MTARMTNPSLIVPDALRPLLDVTKVLNNAGVPQLTLDLIRLCVSQVNGRPIDIPSHTGEGAERRPTDARLLRMDRWRQDPCYSAAERAALALAESASRLSEGEHAVPDAVWDEAARHYDERELGVLVLQIGLVNLWNCVNVTTRQVPGDYS